MKISVVIPNYNHSLFLKKRIDSVLHQTYKNIEIIILDDKSSDNSMEIINSYKEHENVKIFVNEKNSGSTFAQWNKGVHLTTGEYIWIAESDDIADQNFLEDLIPHITENISVAYCQSFRMNEKGEITGDWTNWVEDLKDSKVFENNFESDGYTFIKKYLLYKNVIPNASAVIFNKKRFLEVGGADATVKYNSDWFFWIKMLTKGDIYFSSAKNNFFRYHNKSVIGSAVYKELFWKKYDILMRKKLNIFLKNANLNDLCALNTKMMNKEIKTELAFFLKSKYPLKTIKYFFKFYIG